MRDDLPGGALGDLTLIKVILHPYERDQSRCKKREAQCVLEASANENTAAGGAAAGVHSCRPMERTDDETKLLLGRNMVT